MMLRGLGSVVVFALTLWLTRRAAWAVVALAGWWSAVLLTYERQTGGDLLKAFGPADARFAPSWERGRMRRLAWLSLPLGVVMVLISLNTNIPRYFIEHFLGETALGYFAALAYVMVAGYTVMGALGQSATPRLARYYQSNRSAFKRLLAKMMLVAAAVGAAGILVAVLWGRPLLTLLYRRDYAQHADVFVWVMIAAAISYTASMLGYGMTAARLFRAQVPLFATCSLGITVTCALLMKSHGMIAAAYALVVGSCIAAIGAVAILMLQLRRQGRLAEQANA
jgi:O-antigen/teichoic acid export membrane protein